MSPAAEVVAAEVASFPELVRDLPVTPEVTPHEIRTHLREHYDFAEAHPLVDVLQSVIDMLRRWNLHTTHPRYFGLFNPSVHEAGVWADALAALYNPQMAAWAHAPAASEIERHVLRFLGGFLGLTEPSAGAHFTSGGSEANHTAVLLALASRCPGVFERGLAAPRARPLVYLSAGGHHSFQKIVRVTGLGEAALRRIPMDGAFRLDVEALELQLRRDRAVGCRPVMAIGTAGTTAAGMIDPLSDIADVCAAHDLWFHVDGAWGASGLLSPLLQPSFAGIERADSVTWDAHKWLCAPMGAGMLFTRHPSLLRRVFSTDAGYVPAERDAVEDPYLGTMQWSRRFIGLKVFLTLATRGAGGLGADVEHQAAMGERLRDRLVEAGWIVVNDTPLPVVCFTHPVLRRGELAIGTLLERVLAKGRVWISEVAPDGHEHVLRACITSHRTREEDLDVLLEELQHALAGPVD